MKALIVEDEFISRKVLQTLLSNYGETDIAADGSEALEAIRIAEAENTPYDLICLDIQMPKMDGHAVLNEIRTKEKENGIIFPEGVKIIMTTSSKDIKSISSAFHSLCNHYLVKPIEKNALLGKLNDLGLVKSME
jgi:two-component system chemotaxis response regulator CheY